jgi:hypothetical protein
LVASGVITPAAVTGTIAATAPVATLVATGGAVRQIYVKRNGAWTSTLTPRVKNNGAWSTPSAVWYRTNGTWTKVWGN